MAIGHPAEERAGPGLVGRSAESAVLDSAMEDIKRTGAAVLLRGDPGVGKTALLDRAAQHAERAGLRVLRAIGAEPEAGLPFAALHQALYPLAERIEELPDVQRAALRRAFGVAGGTAPERFAISAAALALLQQAARTQPLLLIMDDVQWIDAESAETLGFVVRRLAGLPLVLVAAARGGWRNPLDPAGMRVVDVGPLGLPQATLLLETFHPHLAPGTARRMLDDAAGNPLALLELPAQLTPGQRAGAEPLPAALPLGEQLETAFAVRVRVLPDPVRYTLLLAALDDAGPSSLHTIRAAAQGSWEGWTEHVLDLAEAGGLVAVDPDRDRVVFSHPLVRAAVIRTAASGLRRAAHRALAQARADDPERRALHLAEAAVGPDEAVAGALAAAAGRALAHASTAEAAAALSRAADLSPDPAAGARRRVEAAFLAAVGGHLGTAEDLLRATGRAPLPPGPALRRATAAALVMLHRDGDAEGVHHEITPALAAVTKVLAGRHAGEAAPGVGDAERIAHEAERAAPAPAAGHPPDAGAIPGGARNPDHTPLPTPTAPTTPRAPDTGPVPSSAENTDRTPPPTPTAPTTAQPPDTGPLLAEVLDDALFVLTDACFWLGRPDMWEPVRRAFGQLSERGRLCYDAVADPARTAQSVHGRLRRAAADLPPGLPFWRLNWLICAAFQTDAFCELSGVWHLLDSRGTTTSHHLLSAARAYDAYAHGCWDEAESVAGAAIERAGQLGHRFFAHTLAHVPAQVAASRGDLDTLRELNDRITRWAQPRQMATAVAMVAGTEARAAVTRGAYEEAYAHAGRLTPPGELPPYFPHFHHLFLDLVEAAVRTGRTAEARAHVAAGRRARIDAISPHHALILAGAAALAAEDAEAGGLFEAALAVPGADRWPFEKARIELAYGEWLRRRQERTAARLQLAGALETFHALRAGPWARRAGEELRAAGAPQVEPPDGVLSPLTAQEQRIAELAATGMTNKEIGLMLHLSPRTVGSHLYRIFPKLGIASRVALRDTLSSRGHATGQVPSS